MDFGLSDPLRMSEGAPWIALPALSRQLGAEDDVAEHVYPGCLHDVGWERHFGLEGRFVGIHSFGALLVLSDVPKRTG
jgi:hypothetical protein